MELAKQNLGFKQGESNTHKATSIAKLILLLIDHNHDYHLQLPHWLQFS